MSKIVNYIATFDPIPKGTRDNALYIKGLLLRRNFGLTGNALYEALSGVNATKCEPPLSDSEVRKIADSVDKSNTPVGEPTEYTARPAAPIQKPVRRLVPAPESVTITSLLSKQVCVYPHARENAPIGTASIGKILEAFRTGGNSRELIEAIRSETDKEARDELKKKLPGVVFASEPQERRKIEACKPNGIICLDFDGIPEGELDTAKQAIAEVGYVFAVGLSASRRGLFALAAYSGMPDLKILLAAMQADFSYELDMQCSDISRLRFVTQDAEIIIKGEGND